MIQTRGFQVDNMARFTPSDPSLIAFNPSGLISGARGTYALMNDIEKMKAYRKLQAELDATREKRINAANAGADASIAESEYKVPHFGMLQDKIGEEGDVISAKNAAQLKTLPVLADETVAKGRLGTEQALADLGIVSDVTEAKKLQANELAGTSRMNLRLMGPKEDALVTKYGLEAATNRGEQGNLPSKLEAEKTGYDLSAINNKIGSIIAPAKGNLEGLKIKDATDNFQTDADLTRDQAQAKYDQIQAEIKYLKSHADYYENGGAAKAPRDFTAQLANLERAAATLEKTHGLKAYEEENYNSDGKLKTGFLGMFKGKEDPTKEAARTQRDMYQKAGARLMQRQADMDVQDTGVAADAVKQQPKVTSQASRQDAEALKWAMNPQNQNHPKYQEVVGKLRKQGLIK